jgi:hypothetical protein
MPQSCCLVDIAYCLMLGFRWCYCRTSCCFPTFMAYFGWKLLYAGNHCKILEPPGKRDASHVCVTDCKSVTMLRLANLPCNVPTLIPNVNVTHVTQWARRFTLLERSFFRLALTRSLIAGWWRPVSGSCSSSCMATNAGLNDVHYNLYIAFETYELETNSWCATSRTPLLLACRSRVLHSRLIYFLFVNELYSCLVTVAVL